MAPMSVNTEAGYPLDRLQLRYRHVQEQLAGEIERGGRPAGSRLPPERALAEHFGVSRVTLRRALDELARTGVVARSGSGWVVASLAWPASRRTRVSVRSVAARRARAAGTLC